MRPDRARTPHAIAALLLLSIMTPACATRTVESALPPNLVVERFLRAANSTDLDTMARLFGDIEGPWSTTVSKKDADERLFTLATLLRHSDYDIKPEQIVPGRREEATRLPVELTIRDRALLLPFILVRYGDSWLIESIPIEIITNAR